MYNEGAVVELLRALSPDSGSFWPEVGGHEILAGAVGAVVAVYGTAPLEVYYEVEFVAEDGSTLGILTLSDSDIAPLSGEGRG